MNPILWRLLLGVTCGSALAVAAHAQYPLPPTPTSATPVFIVNPTTGVAQGATGSSGVDRSANAPTGPGSASSFSFNGTTLNLLSTIAANTSRRNVEINNTTGSQVVLVIDDGANTAGSVSLFPLAAGSGAFAQGGDFSSQSEQGRIRIYGTTGTYCYAREN